MVLIKFPVESTGIPFQDFQGTPVNLEPAVSQLERYRLLMNHWCDQNCSLTVSYSPEEVPLIIDWLYANWGGYVGVSWAFRTDPTKTAADFGAAYLPQQVVSKSAYDLYVSQLRPVEMSGGAVEMELLEDDCASGVCPIR
jgi:ribonucleoside-triphosphate reductase